jgi:hypothetical protein
LLVSWNHRPALVRAALERSRGFARWKPRWHVLVAPTGDAVGGASNVFSLADQTTGESVSFTVRGIANCD